jgi:hypothetical protein
MLFMKLPITQNCYPTFSVFKQQSEKGGGEKCSHLLTEQFIRA